MKKLLLIACFLPFFAQAQTLTDSLKAYWSFDGNAMDISGYGNHGTVGGATLVADRLGNPNSAYYFNGLSDYISHLTSPSLRPTTFPVSISAWIKCSTIPPGPGGRVIIGTEYNSSNGKNSGFFASILPTSGAIQINFGDNTGACNPTCRRSKSGNTNVCDGQWHLLTFVAHGATSMELYIDCNLESGTYSGSGATNVIYSGVPDGRIGDFKCGLTGYNGHFEGAIDEVRFYHRALSLGDVIALYNYTAMGGNIAAGTLGNDTSICSGNIMLDATSGLATSYSWSNGSSSPTLSVNSPGTYWVNITGNACLQSGADTIVLTSGSQSSFIPDTVVCKNQIIVLNAPSGYTNYLWSTGATTQSISVSTSGMYILQATNPNGCNLLDTIQVNYIPTNPPLAQFTYTLQPNGVIQLNNTSLYSSQYQWTYSNGGADTAFSPQHNFPCNVPVVVTLISSGRCGADTATQTITYMCDAVEDMTEKIDLQVFPQPAQSVLNITYQFSQPENVRLTIHNALGQKVYEQIPSQQVGKIKNTISIEKWAEGYYFLQIVTEKGLAAKKIWITK